MVYAKDWVLCSSNDVTDVDKFASELKKRRITQDKKVMTSLSSKLLFLNDPILVMPMDKFNKKALDEKTNTYHNFKVKLDQFVSENEAIALKSMKIIDSMLKEVEANYPMLTINFSQYRVNRFLDKLLWVNGKN